MTNRRNNHRRNAGFGGLSHYAVWLPPVQQLPQPVRLLLFGRTEVAVATPHDYSATLPSVAPWGQVSTHRRFEGLPVSDPGSDRCRWRARQRRGHREHGMAWFGRWGCGPQLTAVKHGIDLEVINRWDGG
jgi:hypothetical protein